MDKLYWDKRTRRRDIPLFYLFWIVAVIPVVFILLTAIDAFRLLTFYLAAGGLSVKVTVALEKFFVFFVGVASVGFVVFIQEYFYGGLGKGLLLFRFLRVLGIEFLILAVISISFVLLPTRQEIFVLSAGIAEFVIGIVLMVFSYKILKRVKQ